MTDHKEDQEFEEYLAGKSVLSDRYAQLDEELPSGDIDDRILGEAERAVKVTTLTPKAGQRNWMVPAALAATVLLSFSLVMRIVTDAPRGIEPDALFDLEQESGDDGASAEAKAQDQLASTDTSERAEPERDRADAGSIEGMQVTTYGAFAEGQAIAPETVGRANEPRPAAPAKTDTDQTSPLAKKEMAALATTTAPGAAASLDQMIGLIRERLSSEESLAGKRSLDEAEVPAADAIDGNSMQRMMAAPSSIASDSGEPDDQAEIPSAGIWLEDILWRYDSGDIESAAQSIVEFRRSYPDHPVSTLLLAAGY